VKVSHLHCRVRDLQAADRWSEQGPGGRTVEIEDLLKRT